MINEMRKLHLERRKQEAANKHSADYHFLTDIVTGNPSSSNPIFANPKKIAEAFSKLRDVEKSQFEGLLDERKATFEALKEKPDSKYPDAAAKEVEGYKERLRTIKYVEESIGRVKES